MDVRERSAPAAPHRLCDRDFGAHSKQAFPWGVMCDLIRGCSARFKQGMERGSMDPAAEVREKGVYREDWQGSVHISQGQLER